MIRNSVETLVYTDYFDRPPIEEEDMLLDEIMADFTVVWPQTVVVQHTLPPDRFRKRSGRPVLVLGLFLRFADVCAAMLSHLVKTIDDFYVARLTDDDLRTVLLHQPNPCAMDAHLQGSVVHLLQRWLVHHSDNDGRHLFMDEHGDRDPWTIAYVRQGPARDRTLTPSTSCSAPRIPPAPGCTNA